jgi:RimJ/RimL family protein N-acetyltransferase
MKEIYCVHSGKFFLIKKLSVNDINHEYIAQLRNQKFLLDANNNLKKNDQVKYINEIRKDKSREILGVFHKKKLIATSGIQELNKKKVFIGIFLFNKKFLKKNLSYFFINLSMTFIYKYYKKRIFIAKINNKNFKSIKAFTKVGFKRLKKSFYFQLKIS